MRNKLGLDTSLVQRFSLKQKFKYAFWGAAIYGLCVLGLSFFVEEEAEQTANIFYAEVATESPFSATLDSSKLYFLTFHTDFCEPCQYMEEKVLSRVKLSGYIQDKYTPLKIDPVVGDSSLPMWVHEYKTTLLPTYLILDYEGREVKRFSGVVTAQEFYAQLEAKELKAAYNFNNLVGHADHKRLDKSFSVQIGEFYTYLEAREFAENYRTRWDGEIWIDTNKGEPFKVLIGRYERMKDAKIVAALLREMDQEQPEIVKLNKSQVSYPASIEEMTGPSLGVIP